MDIAGDINKVTIKALKDWRALDDAAATDRAIAFVDDTTTEYNAQVAALDGVVPAMQARRDSMIHLMALNAVYVQVKAGTLA